MGFSDLGKKLSKLGQDTKNGVQKVSDSVSISNRISAEKKSLGRLFATIGETMYKESPDVPKEGLEDEWAAVKVAYANIASLSEQLNHVKGIRYCPNCGRPAADGDKFCAKCGFRLEPVTETTGTKMAQDLKEAGQEVGRIAGSAAGKTGEAVGGAAAQTRNAFAKLKDSAAKLFKETGEKLKKMPKPDEADPDEVSEEEETFSVEVDEEVRAEDSAAVQEMTGDLAEAAEAGADTAAEAGEAVDAVDAAAEAIAEAEAAGSETAAETAESVQGVVSEELSGADEAAAETVTETGDDNAAEAGKAGSETGAETDDAAQEIVSEETAEEDEAAEKKNPYEGNPLFETPLTPEEMAAEAAEPAQGAAAADPEYPFS